MAVLASAVQQSNEARVQLCHSSCTRLPSQNSRSPVCFCLFRQQVASKNCTMAILSLYTDSKRLICAFGLFGIVTAQPCYWKSNNTVRAQDAAGIYPCPNTETHSDGTQLCCLVGSQCGIDGICRFPEATVDSGPPDSPGRSGWNTGGCTDPSYSDPVCPTECSESKVHGLIEKILTTRPR